MNKYRSLDLLLQRLQPALKAGRIIVSSRWNDDEEAIGFYKAGDPELAANVTTHGQPPGWYDLELEFPDLDDNHVQGAPTTAEDIQIDEVVSLLAMHFDLTGTYLEGPSTP